MVILKTVNKIIAYLQAYIKVVSKLHIFINNVIKGIEILDRKYFIFVTNLTMFLTLGSGPQDKKWRQRLRSWDKSCLGGWVAWWFGGTAAANVLSQWCGISFIAAE